MLRRDGRLIAVILAAFVAALLMLILLQPREPQLPTYDHPETATANYEPGGSGCQPQVLSSIRDDRKAIAERARCAEAAEEYRLKREDLIQQARSADAAEAEARLTWYLARMALWGTVGGFLTLIAASLAALYARDAAIAARENLQAFTDVEQAGIVVTLEDFAEPSGRLHFKPIANNLGRSSALIVFVGHAWTRVMDDRELALVGEPKSYIVKPNDRTELYIGKPLLVSHLEQTPFLWMRVVYKSALQPQRHVTYCFEVSGLNSNVPYVERIRKEFDPSQQQKRKWWKQHR